MNMCSGVCIYSFNSTNVYKKINTFENATLEKYLPLIESPPGGSNRGAAFSYMCVVCQRVWCAHKYLHSTGEESQTGDSMQLA